MTDKINIKLLFFAKAREIVGAGEVEFVLSGRNHSVKTLLDEVLFAYPALQPISSSLILAVNEEYISTSETVNLKDKDVVAIMPPLSGG